MTLLYIKRYYRDYIQQRPEWLFVFGDNWEAKGYAGQAFHARGEPNAIGISTKKYPAMTNDSFFTDHDYNNWIYKENAKLRLLINASRIGRVIIWPLDGIGTGLSQLQKRAPLIWNKIEDLRLYIE